MEYRIFRLLLGSIIAVGLLSGLFSSIGFGRRILCGGASLTMWRVQLWIAVRFAFFLCVCKCVFDLCGRTRDGVVVDFYLFDATSAERRD